MITQSEEANLARTLASVAWADEIIIVDSGSTDRTEEIARGFNARFYVEPWQGFGKQKNSALEKCTGDWVLSLDADEEVSSGLALEVQGLLINDTSIQAWFIPRENLFLGRTIRHGGYSPDHKLRLVRRGIAHFEDRSVHETLQFEGKKGFMRGSLIHYAYPTLAGYIEHMDRYSTLGAQRLAGKPTSFFAGVVLNPIATFIYNYFLRAGFLDGREGLLLHLYHSCYVSWKYAKAWEIRRGNHR